jgi:Domain of unknown function (DUF5916)/Carbohydrate family 9 binding domain-like
MKKRFAKFKQKGPLSIIAFLTLFLMETHAQTTPTKAVKTADTTAVKYTKPKPSYTATRVLKAPKIDGKLDDAAWQNVPKGVDFVQFEPKPFTKPTNPTEVQLVYDNEAVYVSAYMHDAPKNIRSDFSQRDRDIFEANTDYFTVSFDTYNDDQNGFRFVVTPRNIQADARIAPNNTDFNWDGVWVSATSIVADGWIVEIKIPYFNLRFAKKTEQKWGVQFSNKARGLGEVSAWSPLDPKIDGQAIQWGDLDGIKDIEPPLRLQFSPYIAADYKSIGTTNDDGKNIYGQAKSITGGLDMKVGLNDAFTLDATLIPNFGQVQSDNKFLNLSPFEQFFQERRPFFTEGTDLFGRGDIFYSRRIGGRPRNFYGVYNDLKTNEIVDKNPEESQLYNATKVSGRNSNKLGIGVLNAVSAPMFATIKDTLTGKTRDFKTGELTNYNVLVFDQLLKNNSSFSFTNTATVRDGSGRDANSSALRLKLRDKGNKYEFGIRGRMSHVFTTNNGQNNTKSGYSTDWNGGKVSGNWTWSLGQELVTDKWDPSDLGFFQQNNYLANYANLQYQQTEPGKVFLQSNWWVGLYQTMRYEPFVYQDMNLNMGFWGKFKNQGWANYYMNIQPKTYDYFESRGEGKFARPPQYRGGLNAGTDDRKRLQSYFYLGLARIHEWNNTGIDLSAQPTYRVSSRFRIGVDVSPSFAWNDLGYNFTQNDGSFGNRDLLFVNTSISFIYNFTPYANLTFRARHNWTRLAYNSFYDLQPDGSLKPKDGYNKPSDVSSNYFNIDCIYTWQFAPGSFFNFIWKNSLDSYVSSNPTIRNQNYFQNIKTISEAPQNNNFTVKMIYFVDYNKVKNVFKKG